MKKITTLLFAILTAVTSYGQTTLMNVYKNDGTIVTIPLSSIDSITYTMSSLATLTTSAPSSVTDVLAMCGGNITNDGGTPVTARGVVYGLTSNPTLADNIAASGSGSGSFSTYLTGLTAATTYYARAYATNTDGTNYGNQVTFTTDSASAAVTTIVIPDTVMSNVYYHQTSYLNPTKLSFPNLKQVNGYVYFHQTNNIVEVDFPALTSTDAYFYVNGNVNMKIVSAPALTSIYDYLYIRLNSTLQVLNVCNLADVNCSGSEPYVDVSGNNSVVDSIHCINPTLHGSAVTTAPVTVYSNNTAVANGTITHNCNSSMNYGVCWSTSPNPTTNNSTAGGSGGTNFSANMTGLSPNTTYYVRAYYDNGIYGNEVSFTTLP